MSVVHRKKGDGSVLGFISPRYFDVGRNRALFVVENSFSQSMSGGARGVSVGPSMPRDVWHGGGRAVGALPALFT